jgi:hypothetical protein
VEAVTFVSQERSSTSTNPDEVEEEFFGTLRLAAWEFVERGQEGRRKGLLLACRAVIDFIHRRNRGAELAAPFDQIAERCAALEKPPSRFLKKKEPSKERWLRHMEAAVTIAHDLGLNISKTVSTTVFDACEAGVRSRIKRDDGTLISIHLDWWTDVEIRAWDIRFPGGLVTNRAEIEINAGDLCDWVDEQKSAAASSPKKKPTKEKLRDVIKSVYDEAAKTGKKPPNINELADAVALKLEAKGYTATKASIKSIGEEPEFASRRGLVGKRVSSKQRH